MTLDSPTRNRRRTRFWVLVAIAAIVLLLIAIALWIVIRGSMARTELLDAVPLAQRIEADAVDNNTSGVTSNLATLQQHAERAASLTSDPIWRAAEIIPYVGPNLVVFRQSAALIDSVATKAIPTVVGLSSSVRISDFVPKNGQFNLPLYATIQPVLTKANTAFQAEKVEASRIDSTGTIAPIGAAANKLVTLVNQTADAVNGIDVAAKLLPTMLGGHGQRHYLLMSLNSSELRTPGGIPGALAIIDADNGHLTLDQRISATALGPTIGPALPLSKSELALYKSVMGEYMQDVVSTPDFKRAGQLAQAIWKQKTGQTIDGVVAIDPVALGYLLKATGPLQVSNGITLTSADAASILLSKVYALIPNTTKQDVFFASVTRTVFSALTASSLDSHALVNALGRSASENRIHIWSAHPSEEKTLSASTLAGGLEKSTKDTTAFGVFLDDATGAKMDYYMRNRIDLSSGVCRADNRPNFTVGDTLFLDAPKDAATALPTYVTGRYAFGVKPGRVKTNVYVYAPAGAEVYSVAVNGKQVAFVEATLDGHPVVGTVVEMGPGDRDSIVYKFVGKVGAPTAMTLQSTPMYSPTVTSTTGRVNCSSP